VVFEISELANASAPAAIGVQTIGWEINDIVKTSARHAAAITNANP